MAEEKYTRCPACRTVFRVTSAQLAIREGQVRCGHCKTVFDGPANMISLAPRPADEEHDDEFDELALGPPTVTLRSARALDPAPAPEPVLPSPGTQSDSGADSDSPLSAAADGAPAARHRALGIVLGIAVPVLALALVAQALFHFRDAIASRWPQTSPALARLCAQAGCALHPLREIDGLSIDASDLQADPAHKGLLILTATLRNRAAYALAYPHVELTLTDAQDQVVVRRALAPREYASGTADLTRGIAANAEVALKLFIDASATTQAGYRLYLFYP